MELRRVIFRSAVLVERPGERPLHAALLVGELRPADEGLRRQRLALLQRRGEKVGEPVGEVDVVLLRRMVALFQKALVAGREEHDAAELGRAACRERVCQAGWVSVVDGCIKKKNTGESECM